MIVWTFFKAALNVGPAAAYRMIKRDKKARGEGKEKEKGHKEEETTSGELGSRTITYNDDKTDLCAAGTSQSVLTRTVIEEADEEEVVDASTIPTVGR